MTAEPGGHASRRLSQYLRHYFEVLADQVPCAPRYRSLGHPAAVTRAGRALPGAAGGGLQAFGAMVLALVEQAVGEGVLAGQVRADAQVPGLVPGQDGVLVVAKHGLDLLHLPGEPAGRPVTGRAGGLRCVTGAPRRLAGL